MFEHPKQMTPDDARLLTAVEKGNTRRAEKISAAGQASVDGDGRTHYRPLLLAAELGLARMAKVLIDNGANLDAGSPSDLVGNEEKALLVRGATAVNFAGFFRQTAVLRLLLRAGANPNAVDSNQATALLLTCRASESGLHAAVVEEVLKAGADPTIENDVGNLPLHYAAVEGDTESIGLLLEAAPSTVNRATKGSMTPLCVACAFGQAQAVSCLLSAGATSKGIPCPLATATANGHESVIRVLLGTKERVEAFGGVDKLPPALCHAVQKRSSCAILNVLLSIEGESRRRYWAQSYVEGFPILAMAVTFDILAAVKVLLAAGTGEQYDGDPSTAHISAYQSAQNTNPDDKIQGAITRALMRGHAFRARSWTFPAAATSSTTGSVHLGGVDPSHVPKPAVSLGARIFRPNNKSFVLHIQR